MKLLKTVTSLNAFLAFCSLLVLCQTRTMAQTADDHVNEGRALLAARDLVGANAEFAAAVASAPNHATGNVFYAATRLLTLANRSAGAAFLDRLGFASVGRSVYGWTAFPPVDGQGVPFAPANVSAAEISAFLRTNILVEITGAASNLARVTDTNFTLTLSGDETTTVAVTMDYGDLLLLRSGLQIARYAAYTIYSWNVDAQLTALRLLVTNQTTTAQGFLAQYPNLFTFATTNDLAAARQAFTNAVALYLSASDFIRHRPPGVTRLFNYDPSMAEAEADFRTTLTELNQSLNGPVVLTVATNYTISLNNHFSGAHPPRAFLPQFSGDTIIAGTLPDSTFGGLIQGWPSYQVEELLGKRIPFISHFTLPRRFPGGGLQITLDALNNTVFLIQVSTNLQMWSDFALGLAQAGAISFNETNTGAMARRFYRAVELPEALSVAGDVIDVSTGGRLTNAMVVLSFPGDSSMTTITNYTDSSGHFILISRLEPPSDDYSVTFSVPGYTPFEYHGYYWDNPHLTLPVYVAPDSYRPANDNFSQRLTLTGTNISTTGYNLGATKEPGEPNHAGVVCGQSVWWTWTAPTDGAVIIDTVGSSFDTVLGIYTGNSVSNLAVVVSDDNSGDNWTSKVEFLVTAGTAYQIAVDGHDSGRVVLNVRTTTPRRPSIVWGPRSQTVAAGGFAYFSAGATGTPPLVYQWLKDGAVVQGANNSWYWINNVQANDAGSYTLTVSNGLGVATSTPAVLTVVPGPVTLQEIYSFLGPPEPFSPLVQGSDGSFYGTTSQGGSNGCGSVFRVTTNGILTTLLSFANTNGASPRAGLVQGSDWAFYGTTASGGGNGYGTVFRVTTNGVLTTLVSFNYGNGANPYAGLVQGSDGAFYGTTANGGSNGGGTVFRVTTNGILTTVLSFANTNGAYPQAGLVQGSEGAFYGTTCYGGSNGSGTVFRVTTNGILTTLQSFANTDGAYPKAGLVQGSDGAFYGTTANGGSNGYGTVFLVTTNGVLTTLVSFDYGNGASACAGLVQGADGAFYGTTVSGGSNGYGTVFRMAPDGVLTTLVSFNYANGCSPQAGLVQGSDGAFYGTTCYGGSNGNGTVFRVTTSGALTILVSFASTGGADPQAGLVQGNDRAFFGTTCFGGSNNYGTAFQVTTNGVLTTLVTFDNGNGANPRADMVRGSDGALYGTTPTGGSGYYGTVFRETTNGTLTTLASFVDYGNGARPYAGLVQATDGALYGTTCYGGSNGFGTVFRVTTNGVLTTLVSLNYGNGAYPYAGLAQSGDGAFYGTTANGGSSDQGTVFRVTTSGNLTTLLSFAITNGASPRAGLVQGSGGAFYGTTANGGSNDYGTVFRVTTNGVLTTLVSFADTTGVSPLAGLVQGSDGAFYGTTANGGINGCGTVFRMAPDGVLTTLVSFTYANGCSPQAGLVQASDGTFYGTTYGGGSRGGGNVFRMILDPLILARPTDRTCVAGSTAAFAVVAQGTAPLQYQWQRNGINLYDGGNVAGAATPNLTLSNTTTNDAATYTVVVSSASGSQTSLAATLTVLIRPQLKSITRLSDKNIQFTVSGVSSNTCRIDASANLINWVTLTNITITSGPIQFIDLNATNFSKRFYRASYTP